MITHILVIEIIIYTVIIWHLFLLYLIFLLLILDSSFEDLSLCFPIKKHSSLFFRNSLDKFCG